VKARNPHLFKSRDQKLSISAATLEMQIRLAYERGRKDGLESARNEKSEFEKIFGKLVD
jgi:hypothetical protein